MNEKEWKDESNSKAKESGSAYRVYNLYRHWFLLIWFWVTLVLIIGTILFVCIWLSPYVEFGLDYLSNNTDIINYLNNTGG